jgi:hypothetical protein
MALAGAGMGFVLGIISFFGLVIPYVWCLVQYEQRYPETPMIALWEYMALPVMLATLILSAFLPWFAVGLLL